MYGVIGKLLLTICVQVACSSQNVESWDEFFPRPNLHCSLNPNPKHSIWEYAHSLVQNTPELQAREQVSTVVVFVTDNPEEHERLELRSRTEVRLTEGEAAEESVIYQFTGKTARE